MPDSTAPSFWAGAELPTRPLVGLGWVKKELPVAGNPTPGSLQPPLWAVGESGIPARPAAALPFPEPLPEDVQHGHRMRVTS